jgi:hypothetical protein
VPGAGVPGAGVGEADVAGVLEPDDAGAPVVLVGVGVRVVETVGEVVVLVTVTGALVPPEHPAANSATAATAMLNVFMNRNRNWNRNYWSFQAGPKGSSSAAPAIHRPAPFSWA